MFTGVPAVAVGADPSSGPAAVPVGAAAGEAGAVEVAAGVADFPEAVAVLAVVEQGAVGELCKRKILLRL
jgi:hypothetical protein